MSLSPQPFTDPAFPSSQRFLKDLIRIQESAQRISSTLDLDRLLDEVVNEVGSQFQCIETSIFLRDFESNEVFLAGVRGCTIHGKGARLKISSHQGMVGWVAATGETRYAPDVRRDPFYIECEPGTLSELAIPLKVRGQVIGVFSVSLKQLDGFSPEQRQLLEVLAGHIAVAIENARLFQQERLERARVLRDAEEARLIQQGLFPKSSPYIPGFSVQGVCAPAGAVSGDWYDYIQLPDGRWGLVLADVSGKGMAAALLMSATRRLVRSLVESIRNQRRPSRTASRRPRRDHGSGGQLSLGLPGERAAFNQLALHDIAGEAEPGISAASPGEVLSRVNWELMDELPMGKYVTMIYGVLDPAKRTLTFANAGHPWPVLVEGSGARFLPTTEGIPLGLTPGRYSEETVTLAPGSRLLFYSDGITEATGGFEEYGTDRLFAYLSRPDACADRLLNEVREFCGNRPLADDATLMLIRA